MSDGGKGSRARPFSVPLKTFDEHWDNIFKKDKEMQVRATQEGKIGTCGCGRSPTGDCIGWHGLNEQQLKEAQEKYQAQQTETK
jgi:hypothetical protein